jgi:hypothetical protein
MNRKDLTRALKRHEARDEVRALCSAAQSNERIRRLMESALEKLSTKGFSSPPQNTASQA